MTLWRQFDTKCQIIGTREISFSISWIFRKCYPLNFIWAHQDSNLEPIDYESTALPIELWAPKRSRIDGYIREYM